MDIKMSSPSMFACNKPKIAFSSIGEKATFIIKNGKEIWDIYEYYVVEGELRKERYRALLEKSIIERPDFELDNPTIFSGSAIMYAQKYNIEFCSGMARSQVKAYLPKEYWKQEPEKTFGYGWVDRDDICAAVCDCILNCIEDGLLQVD